MAERTRGMGRGLSAILSSTVPAAEGGELHPELREIPLELIAPNPRQPRQEFDEAALLALAESLRERGVLQPVLLRPVAGGTYELIAGERRWRAAQIAGFERVPALVRAARRRRVARARADREHGPRGPQPRRGGARLRAARRGARAHARGRRPPRRPLARRGLEPAADPRPARRRARPAHGRHAQRGPRPRAADGLRPRGPPPPRPHRGRRGLDRPPHRGAGPRRRGPQRARRPPHARLRRRSTPTRRRPPAGSATPSAGRSAPTSGSPRAATATRSRWPSTRSTRRWPWRSVSGPSSPPDTAARRSLSSRRRGD